MARLVGPLQEFIREQSAGSLLLFGAAVVALLMANSPLSKDYHHALETHLGIFVGAGELDLTLEAWINDGLMAIFFLLVGLEIKREFLVGELSNRRAAMLPLIAAAGGALVPAALYFLINLGQPGASGWGIPMATDIAFTLGTMAILGRHAPFGLKVLMTAVAISDDLIAVMVIALFYSSEVDLRALAVAGGLLAAMLAANVLGVRRLSFYLMMGVLVWLAVLESGIHASIAGVLVALTIPARRRQDRAAFVNRAQELVDAYRDRGPEESDTVAQQREQAALIALEDEAERAEAPLQRLEHALEKPVNYLVIPIFALANAGVALSLDVMGDARTLVAVGVFVGLVLGKPLGFIGATWLAVRSGLAHLPAGVRWRHLIGGGLLSGIGFTMSIFIASLAFGAQRDLLEAAKLGILIGSVVAGVLGFVYLRRAPETRGAVG